MDARKRDTSMHGMPPAGPGTAIGKAIDRHPFLVPFLIYVAFATAVFALHGPEPALSIDHIAYFKLADEIRADFPGGDYWRTANSVRAYGVMLAYLLPVTGSHVVSLKLMLAAMTIAYFFSFQIFMGLATDSKPRAVLFSLMSGLFVSFGASIWGITDFAASLNRTLIIPFVVLLVWLFFRSFSSPWRYAVFPALTALSLLHLSALHVFIVFGVLELLDFIFRRRFRPDWNVVFFAIAMAASGITQFVIESFAGGTVSYVRYTLNMAVPSLAEMLPVPPPEVVPPPAAEKPAAAAAPPPEVVPPPPVLAPATGAPSKLTNQEAWKIELMAFPWRNFPPSMATLATIASSYGIIFLLALAGAVRTFRMGEATELDANMGRFALASVIAAYGLQMVLWVLRDRVPVFPVNFEEIRAINMIMIPSVYFVYRLYEFAPSMGRLAPDAFRLAVLVAFVLQPILIVRAMPAQWREAIIERSVALGVLKSSDAPRMLYARQFLGLAGDGRRFYYSSRPMMEWLERNARPGDLVLTNLNEFHMSSVKAVGPFLGIISLDVWDVRRKKWAESVEAIDRALMSRDIDEVLGLGRSLGATFAVVDWPVEGAVFRDEHFSVVRIPERR